MFCESPPYCGILTYESKHITHHYITTSYQQHDAHGVLFFFFTKFLHCCHYKKMACLHYHYTVISDSGAYVGIKIPVIISISNRPPL